MHDLTRKPKTLMRVPARRKKLHVYILEIPSADGSPGCGHQKDGHQSCLTQEKRIKAVSFYRDTKGFKMWGMPPDASNYVRACSGGRSYRVSRGPSLLRPAPEADLAEHQRLGVLLSCHPKSRTVRKVPYQPTNFPGQLQLSAKLHPPKRCVKEGTDRPTRGGECAT